MGEIIAKSSGLTLSSHIKSVMYAAEECNRKLDLGCDRNILRWFSIIHDLGKANPNWIKYVKDPFHNMGVRHEISSIFFIDAVPLEFRIIVRRLVLSHHKTLVGGDNSQKKYNSFYTFFCAYGDPDYADLHIGDISSWGSTVCDFLKEHYGIDCQVPTEDRCKEIIEEAKSDLKYLDYGVSEYLGVCMLGDHIASCFEDFDELRSNMDKMFSSPDITPFNRPSVNYPLSLIRKDPSKAHTIVIGPTSSGKTDVGMTLCTQNRPIYYMLPYQASINAMFNRFADIYGDSITIGIKHGSLSSLTFVDETTKNLSEFGNLPINIITPFQIMSVCFRLKGYESIVNSIRGCDVILDEVHTYSGLSKSAVYSLIRVLSSLGCHIHILSATMPTAMVNNIMGILGEENTQIMRLGKDDLSLYDRHIIHCVNDIDLNEIVRRYRSGEKVAVVLNQRKFYKKYCELLKSIIDPDHLIGVQMSMQRSVRNKAEEKLMTMMKSHDGCVVVSTQVIEVSLDVSFDCMFTQCSDIMSVIQRLGRVNRHRASTDIYKDVYIITPSGRDGSYNNTYLPYNCDDVWNTYHALEGYSGRVLPENDVQMLIDKIHPTDAIEKSSLVNPWDKNGRWKSKMYCHNANETIANILNFSYLVGIKQSDALLYEKTRNKDLEIPLSSTIKEKKGVELHSRLNGVYVIDDSLVDDKFGYIG